MKKEPVQPLLSEQAGTAQQGSSSSSGHGKKANDKRGVGKGKGHEKKKGKEVVTSASVFSMGPAEPTVKEKRGIVFPLLFEGYLVMFV